MLHAPPGYDLRQLRASKRRGRNRRRFCDKIGHGPWFFTCGFTWLDGEVVESDQGKICQKCEFYVEKT